MVFGVRKNLYWETKLLHSLPACKILTIEQHDFGKYKKLWFTLDHAWDWDMSEGLVYLVSIHSVPGLTGQKQVEDTTPGGMRCSIKRTKALTSQDLQYMQQACNSRTALLTQDAKVYKNTEVSVYEIDTCNGSGLEVKDPQALKEWSASLIPTDTPAASPSIQHAAPQQLDVLDQQTQQTASQHPQNPPAELPSTAPSSNKRRSTSSGLHEDRQASLYHHCYGVSCFWPCSKTVVTASSPGCIDCGDCFKRWLHCCCSSTWQASMMPSPVNLKL